MSILRNNNLTCDVLVAGGGPSGLPAALAAARSGASVILCQDRHVLGGNASSEVRMHIVGADAGGKRGEELETEAREGGIMEEIRLETAVNNEQRSASMLDLVLYNLCRAEPNLELMLNTRVVGAELKGNRIAHAVAERQSTEDRFLITAEVFVDCTGDGQLGLSVGADYQHGREGKHVYKENLATLESDGKTLGSTLLFQARKHEKPMPFTAPPWARKFTEEDLRFRTHGKPGVNNGLEYGYWWVEWGGDLDTIRDNESIRDELLAILLGVWDHVKNDGDHGADNWALDWFGFLPGKRESRRFKGQYILVEQDLFQSTAFEDAIAFGGWPIDTHPPAGVDAADEKPCDQILTDFLFDIPLRSCVSAGLANLMFAGRNISASHIAFASTRVMATCAVIGQGVGTAAAYATAHNINPADLTEDPSAIHAIQQRLLRDDAYLIGVNNQDSSDLALSAEVSASSQQQAGKASNILSGQTRAVFGKRGSTPARAHPGTHRWMSVSDNGLPATLELAWDQNIQPGQIELVFDTGMHRLLTLSHSNAYMESMVWGRGQPETVKDYQVEGRVSGIWQPLVDISGNYQRRRTHRIEGCGPIDRLRIRVKATNGLDHARICEVRVYEPGSPTWCRAE